MDLVSSFINLARIVGAFLCIQWEEATFGVGGKYFPVCSGCFGIYLGSLIALSFFPFLKRVSRKLFSVKYGLLMIVPMAAYWAILNIELSTGVWIINGINEVYSFFGVLLGASIANGAYNLGVETRYADKVLKVSRNFWILTVLLIFASVVVFFTNSADIAILFVASLIFIFGFFGLAGFIAVWAIASVLSLFQRRNSFQSKVLTPLLIVSTILVCFLFFQVLVFESRLELVVLGLLFGAFSFGLFGYSLRAFTLEELGIVKKDWKKQIAHGVLIGVLLYAAFVIYRFIWSRFQEFVSWQPSINYVGIPIILAIVVSEEFFFRGYAISMLERQIDTTVSCVISSILFSLYHQSAVIKGLIGLSSTNPYWNYEYPIMQFVGGLLLSYLFIKKRSLIMPTSVHFTWNVLILAAVPLEELPIFP